MNMIESENWDRPRMEKLETLYRDGLSFSLIAADIGVTRNAAIGKARRMQLPKRVEVITCLPGRARATTGPPRRRREAASIKTAPVREVKRSAVIPDRDYSCTIYDLVDRSCRYPLWPPHAQHHQRFYCGVPDASLSVGVPYCLRHALLCR